ncbi:MAG TPA: hypothetical protein PLH91_07330 [Tenuifilaceae bacterium]|nr:hypothetical protein [Tenuifilaceae bacterium]HPI45025.1 hypothetical protein [Tenuifilaceae bacterium]HPN23338.1 hypothetical protein [Tenuifilaceae bacterium]
MERFNEYIKNNRSLFNDEILLEGHQDRFLEKMRQRNRSHIFRVALSAAATVVLILSLTGALGLFYNQEYIPQFANAIFGERSQQSVLKEMDSYYNSQLLRKYRAIEQIAFNADPSVKPEVLKMLAELELEKEQLESDLNQNPRKEYVVDAIVQNYQVRMEALQRIQDSLSETKQ